MIPLGMGLMWAGYAAGLYGWVLIRGYDVSFKQLVAPSGYIKAPLKDWPKIPAGYTGILPNGQAQAKPGGKTLA